MLKVLKLILLTRVVVVFVSFIHPSPIEETGCSGLFAQLVTAAARVDKYWMADTPIVSFFCGKSIHQAYHQIGTILLQTMPKKKVLRVADR